jgi:hypothetical protein
MTQSDQVRAVAGAKFVRPALAAGKTRFSVAVKDVLKDLVAAGFPPANTPQVCTALRTKEFLLQQGIEIESIDGPPSKMSTTVVYHYRVRNSGAEPAASGRSEEPEPTGLSPEEAGERARKLGESIRGLLKEEMAEFGGAEGFIRWVRGYDEEDAA